MPHVSQSAASQSSASQFIARRVGIAATLVFTLFACTSEESAVLTVGEVGFSETDLLGLSPTRRELLSHLAAFAISQSRNEAEQLFSGAIEIEVDDQRYRRAEAERLLNEAGIDDAELERRYAAAPEWELTIRHLIVLSGRYETEATREAARQKATRALERIRTGEPFPDVAAEVSEEPGAEGRQGLLNPGREDAWVDEFWEAGLALEVGGISDVVETQYGFHVLRLEDRQPVAFAEARSAVVLRIGEQLGLEAQSTANAPRPGAVEFSPGAEDRFRSGCHCGGVGRREHHLGPGPCASCRHRGPGMGSGDRR